ncbi:MAG: hypothetical protein LBI73_13615 [Myroides sp.]|nr:hypothetical protein [Myroides sp.]
MKKRMILLVCILFTISCIRKDYPMQSISNNSFNHYKELALMKGDTTAYYQLSLDYMDSPYDGFLYTALIMANKYNYHIAYYDVYDILTQKYGLQELDEKTKELAIDYLRKGAQKGNKNCIEQLLLLNQQEIKDSSHK